MFIQIPFQSLNTLTDVQEGVYALSVDFLERADGQVRATLSLYTKEGDVDPSIADLVIGEFGGALQICDFVKMADGAWRDSSGLKAGALRLLMPRQVLGMLLMKQEAGKPVEVKHGQ